MKKLSFLVLVIIVLSCGKIIFREITCRPLSIDFEEYMYPQNVKQEITFKNTENDQDIKFTVKDKSVFNTEKYYSDTGCSCSDQSGILATSNQDTTWLKQTSSYIEKNNAKTNETIAWIRAGKKSVFYESNLNKETTYSFKNQNFTDVKIYKKDEKDHLKIKTIVLKRGLGIIFIEQANGDIWINTNNTVKNNTISDFTIEKSTCN